MLRMCSVIPLKVIAKIALENISQFLPYEGETGHALGHLELLQRVGDPATGLPIGSSEKNLAAAIAGETHVRAHACMYN